MPLLGANIVIFRANPLTPAYQNLPWEDDSCHFYLVRSLEELEFIHYLIPILNKIDYD